MCCIALVRCVLVLWCGSAGVVWYPYAGWSLCNSTLSLTSALYDCGCSKPRPGRFTPPERPSTRCIGRLSGPQSRCERVRKISPPPPPGFDPRTVQPVTSRYTDWAIPATQFIKCESGHLPSLTFWRRNYFFLTLVHPVYKMWIIQEPNTLELWNKLHFEETRRVYTMFKIFGTYICWINI